MEDIKIIELFFDRKEYAIAETERKYGGYLSKIAYNILFIQIFCVFRAEISDFASFCKKFNFITF